MSTLYFSDGGQVAIPHSSLLASHLVALLWRRPISPFSDRRVVERTNFTPRLTYPFGIDYSTGASPSGWAYYCARCARTCTFYWSRYELGSLTHTIPPGAACDLCKKEIK